MENILYLILSLCLLLTSSSAERPAKCKDPSVKQQWYNFSALIILTGSRGWNLQWGLHHSHLHSSSRPSWFLGWQTWHVRYHQIYGIKSSSYFSQFSLLLPGRERVWDWRCHWCDCVQLYWGKILYQELTYFTQIILRSLCYAEVRMDFLLL